MDKRRGCLIMGKGLCKKDKSWSGILGDFGNKINNIMSNIQGVVTAMFSDSTAQITDAQKKVRLLQLKDLLMQTKFFFFRIFRVGL